MMPLINNYGKFQKISYFIRNAYDTGFAKWGSRVIIFFNQPYHYGNKSKTLSGGITDGKDAAD
jgi:hypothetical protein